MEYHDYPPEPDFAGDDEFTCSAEIERKMITPDMTRHLTALRDGIVPPDPWAESRTPDMVAAYSERAKQRTIADLLREWRGIEEVLRTCGWEGEAHYVVVGDRLLWTCPGCGEEHDDPADRDDPDPERYR